MRPPHRAMGRSPLQASHAGTEGVETTSPTPAPRAAGADGDHVRFMPV
jgi:hypothetical protein